MKSFGILPASLAIGLLSCLSIASELPIQRKNDRTNSSCNTSVVDLEPQFFPQYKSQRVKVSYGPFSVPGMMDHDGMKNFRSKIPSPCTDCLVTFMQAGLEYPDGSNADANTGMWLHHTVFTVLNRENLVCPKSKAGEPFFASGNERTPFDLTLSGTSKAGYYLGADDDMFMMTELMNMVHEPRDAVLTMVFEFIPNEPAGFERSRPYWLDIGGCGSSNFPAKVDSIFEYSSPKWTGGIHGRISNIMSHLHDGGTHLEIKRNGEVICDSQAQYKNYIHSHTGESMEHISAITACKDLGKTSPFDEWSITAYYNTFKHLPMTTMNGDLEPIMGISIVHVVESKDCSTPVRRPKHHRKHRHLKRNIILAASIVTLSIGLAVMWMVKKGYNFRNLFIKHKYIVLRDNSKDSTVPLISPEYHDEE